MPLGLIGKKLGAVKHETGGQAIRINGKAATCDADVEEPRHAVAHGFGADRRFLSDTDVGGARARHDDVTDGRARLADPTRRSCGRFPACPGLDDRPGEPVRHRRPQPALGG